MNTVDLTFTIQQYLLNQDPPIECKSDRRMGDEVFYCDAKWNGGEWDIKNVINSIKKNINEEYTNYIYGLSASATNERKLMVVRYGRRLKKNDFLL
jgi:hypothetical protein